MDGAQFDQLARLFASRGTRRGLLASAVVAITGAIGVRGRSDAQESSLSGSVVPCVNHLFGSGSATGGHHVTFRVQLTAPAPGGGALVTLKSSKAAIVVPAQVTVPAGESEHTFTGSAIPVSADTSVTVTASIGSCKATKTVTVKAPVLRDLNVQSVIRGGGKGKITVCLTGPAAPGGSTVSLNSNRPSILPVPTPIVVPQGKACLSIVVTAANVSSDMPVTITARKGAKISRSTIVRNFATATPTPTGTPEDKPTNTPVDTPTNTPVDTPTSSATEAPTATATTPATCGSGGPCTVFVSSTVFDGVLGGLAGADSKCQSLASAAGLTGAFKAWLSATAVNASDRFDTSVGPYQLVNGATVAATLGNLVGGGPLVPIDRTEQGDIVTQQLLVWTATNANGTYLGQNCNNVGQAPDWSTTVGRTTAGACSQTDSSWISSGIYPCALPLHLYCFQAE